MSAHPVRLALGYVFLAFLAVMETGVYYTQGVGSPCCLALGYVLMAFQAVMELVYITPICKCFEPELKKCVVLL